MGPIRLLRRPLPLVSIFQFNVMLESEQLAIHVSDLDASLAQVAADDFVCAFDLFLCATLSLHFSFISTGSWVPIPACFLHGFLGPIPWLFSVLFIPVN